MVPQDTRIRAVLVTASLALGLSLGACRDREGTTGAAEAPAMTQGGDRLPAADRAMRITVDLALASSNVDETTAALKAATGEVGGYVSEATVSGADSSRTATLSLKIPTEKLPEFRRKLDGVGRLVSESERAEDVTDQRADLGARLKNARAEERRMLEIMAEKTGNLADVLTAEKSLAEVRERIERLEAQHGTLEKQIAHATLKVVIRSETEVAMTPVSKVGRSFERGLATAGEIAVGLAVFLAAATPTLLMFVLLGYALYRVVKLVSRISRRAAPAPR
jgi:hypothetical protein